MISGDGAQGHELESEVAELRQRLDEKQAEASELQESKEQLGKAQPWVLGMRRQGEGSRYEIILQHKGTWCKTMPLTLFQVRWSKRWSPRSGSTASA